MVKREHERALRCAQDIASKCVGARVRMLSRTMTRMYDDALRPLGVKFAQMNILTVVTLHGPIQPSAVAEMLSLEKSTLSRNLKMLETSGWLKVAAGEVGNTQQLKITPEGAALIEQAAPVWRTVQDELVELLGRRLATGLLAAAERVRDAEASG